MSELLGQGTEKGSFTDTSDLRAIAEAAAPTPEVQPRQNVETYEVLSNYAKNRVHGAPEDVLITHFATDRPLPPASRKDANIVNESLKWFRQQFNEVSEEDINAAEKAFRLWQLFEDMRSTNLVVPKWVVKEDGPDTATAREGLDAKLAAGKITKQQYDERLDNTRSKTVYYRTDEGIPISMKYAPSRYEGLTHAAKDLYMEIKNELNKQKRLAGEAEVDDSNVEEYERRFSREESDAAAKRLFLRYGVE